MIYVSDANHAANCANNLSELLTRVEDTIIAAARRGDYSVRISFIKNADVLSQVQKKLRSAGYAISPMPDAIFISWV